MDKGGRAGMVTIGRLAALSGVSTDTLRHYEDEKLLFPDATSDGGYRLYAPNARRRVHFIRHAQECGFTLAEIKALLKLRAKDASCCGDVRMRAVEKKLQLEGKIRAMQSMSKALDRLIADCNDARLPATQCPILDAFEGVASRRPATR